MHRHLSNRMMSLVVIGVAYYSVLCLCLPGAFAFSAVHTRRTATTTTTRTSIPSSPRPTCYSTPSRATTSSLFMSDVTPNNVGQSGNNNMSPMDDLLSRYWKPPPPPEDTFVMIGDLLSLCVYGISDHFFCQVVARMMVRQTLADPLHHLNGAAAAQVSNGGSAGMGGAVVNSLQAPVWLDLQSPYTDHILEMNLSNQLVNQYSPLLEPMGAATCLLIACWLLAGWFHQAFSYRNTLDCSTERALMVTVQTWLTTCALLFGMVLLSQALCGCDSFYLLKRGDLDYVVDSASVLIMWRFLAAFLLGSGREE